MNILFDQTEAQAPFYNGAAEYAQTLFLKMAEQLSSHPQVKIFCLYRSGVSFRYAQLSPQNFLGNKQVEYIDFSGKDLKSIVRDNSIDLLFTPCLQMFCDQKLGDIKRLGCKVVAVVHDFLDEEMKVSGMQTFMYLKHPLLLLRFMLSRFKVRLLSGNMKKREKVMEELMAHNDATVVTVSQYSRASFLFHYSHLGKEVKVFYSPMKVSTRKTEIENEQLRNVINNGEKYLLILSADRLIKNAENMMAAFHKFKQTHPDSPLKLVTIGYKNSLSADHISLPFVTTSDLENAYFHCHALLYPSLFEGFGYPPLEAMKYGKPVICSNVCSMREVLEDSPIYFSPIYQTDMYKALCTFAETPYEQLADKARGQFQKVADRQNADLQELTEMLLKN